MKFHYRNKKFIPANSSKEDREENTYLKMTTKTPILTKEVTHFPWTNTHVLCRKIL